MKYVTEKRAEELYDEYLDEVNPVVEICGMKYCPSRVLEEVDPIAYNCGLADFLDSEGLTTKFVHCDICADGLVDGECEGCGIEMCEYCRLDHETDGCEEGEACDDCRSNGPQSKCDCNK